MSQFFQDLWESIFTPGPTPTLLIATNVTFAVLQVVLFLLLLATYSIHFVVLSILCAGLWWSINWFVEELKAVQQREKEEDDRKKQLQQQRKEETAAAVAGATGATTDSETEVEMGDSIVAVGKTTGASRGGNEPKQRTRAAEESSITSQKTNKTVTPPKIPTPAPALAPAQAPAPATAASSLQASQGSLLVAAPPSLPDTASLNFSSSRSGVSTEDEWEKVSENETDNK